MNTVIPEAIAQLQRQLDQIRSTEPRGRNSHLAIHAGPWANAESF